MPRIKKESSVVKASQQRSILEFARPHQETTVIKQEDSTTVIRESDICTQESVACPICNEDINHLDIRQRIDHVDTCLVRVTFVETPPTKIKQETRMEMFKSSSMERSKSSSIETDLSAKKKRKLDPNHPKLKYVNGETDTNKEQKAIKPPTSIKATNKKPIPDLKTMVFPVLEDTSTYKIAVDAFGFAPNPEIDQYFLTHFHADHYGGISKKWAYERVFGLDDMDYENESKYKKIIYCTGITGRLLTLRFSIDPRFIKELELDTRYKIKSYIMDDDSVADFGVESNDETPGLYVIPICANHCPGAAIFLFESIGLENKIHRIIHCGDFRVNKDILDNPTLRQFSFNKKNGVDGVLKIDQVYLDTTYMSPRHNLPKQELVCDVVADLFHDLAQEQASKSSLFATWFGILTQSRITDFWRSGTGQTPQKKKKFLIAMGTYIIGKEKLALAILQRLKCMIYVLNIGARKDKYDIFKTYEDPLLELVLTDSEFGNDDDDFVIHLVPMTIVGTVEELSNYFNHNRYYENFERCIGLCPTGWSFNQYRRPRRLEPAPRNELEEIIQMMEHQTPFSYVDDILAQVPKTTKITKGKPDTGLYRLYSVPYSEHSSFRELAYFVTFFNIDKVIPTVNTEHEESVEKMDAHIAVWELARKIMTNQEIDQEVDQDLVDRLRGISLDTF
ncbi:DNA cross-link repair protein PSO2/SNM1 [Candida viswanathii]|uniref:DNA cross-link repair protein PSO2/SNM1 n=1 Tax=Candida viswanathii TaxID=5486 RepID=A0A367Y5M6_9ASCO|nr:DNA cross-link repair protein PSO2/SNM1 [Candida viswanathii]